MPVNHMVWLKFRDGITEARIAEHIESVYALKDQVPGILEISAGRNFTQRAMGCQVGISVVLKDKAALAAYGPHPVHAAAAAALRQDAEIFALDYEF
jgi:hypothetical protein